MLQKKLEKQGKRERGEERERESNALKIPVLL